jgi:hypothetical protein
LRRHLHPRPLREFSVTVSEFAEVDVLATSHAQARWIGFVMWWFGMDERDRGGRSMSSVWREVLYDVRSHASTNAFSDGVHRWGWPVRVTGLSEISMAYGTRPWVQRRLGARGRYLGDPIFRPYLGSTTEPTVEFLP